MNADQTKQQARIAKDATAPRLVLRFAVLTAIGLGLAAATIVLAVRQSSTTHSQRHAVEHTRVATKAVLEPELRSTDLTRRSSTKRRRELDRLFEERVLLEGIREVTLYDAAGRVMYSTSTETRAVDRRAPTDRLLEALRGFVISDVHASRDGTQRWLRTYVPLTVGSGNPAGVAAFEQDYGPIAAAGQTSGCWLPGSWRAFSCCCSRSSHPCSCASRRAYAAMSQRSSTSLRTTRSQAHRTVSASGRRSKPS